MPVNQLKAGALLSYVSMGLHNIIGLVYTPFMLRMMGQSEYGLYSIVASVISYLTVLDLGFGNAIIRYTAKFRAEQKVREQYEMFGMFLIFYCVIGFLALIIGSVLLFNIQSIFDQTMNHEELSKVRIMMSIMIFNLAFTFPMSIWWAIITAYERFVFPKIINIIRIILNPLVMVIMLLMGYRAIGMVVVTTIFNILTLLINYYYCKYTLKIEIHFGTFQRGFFKEVSIYSFWIFLNAIMDRIYWSTGQFVLGMFKGAIVVAVYAVAIQLQSIYMSFSTAISSVFLPKVTAMVANRNDDKEISDLFIRTGRVQYIIMIFVLIGFIVFGKPFVRLWAGADYEEAYWIALLFFVPLTVPLIQNLGITILQARNQMRFRSTLYVIIAFLSLGISIPLAKSYGGIGCALGTSFALFLGQIIIMNIYYWKRVHLDIPTFWKEILKMSIVPIAFGAIWWYMYQFIKLDNWANFILNVLFFILLYVPLIWFTSINAYERNLFAYPIKVLTQKIILRKK